MKNIILSITMALVLGMLCVYAYASPFNDELPSGAFGGGTISSDTFMGGNNFCLGSTINSWCMVQDSNTDFSLNWNSVSKLSVADSSGDLTIQGDIYTQSYTYLDGNSLCFGADGSEWCVFQSGGIQFYYNESKKAAISTTGSMEVGLSIGLGNNGRLYNNLDTVTIGAVATPTHLTGSNDAFITGDLEVDGTAYFDGNIDSRALLYDSTAALNLGTSASTSHSLVAGDVLVGGKLEVNDTAYFDGQVYLYNVTYLNSILAFDPQAERYGQLRTYIDDGLHFVVGNSDGYGNRHIIVTDHANRAKDHDHDTLSPNPTVFFHSVTDPDTDNTQWGSLTHDQTGFAIDAATGPIKAKKAIANEPGTTHTTSFTADETQAYYKVSAPSADTIVTMPDATTCLGTLMTFKRMDASSWGVILTSSDGIDLGTTYNITGQMDSQDIRCDADEDQYYLH